MHQYKPKDQVSFKRDTKDNETGITFKAGINAFVSAVIGDTLQLEVPIGDADEITQVHRDEVIPVYKRFV